MMKYLAEYLRLSIEDGDVAIDIDKKESDSISHQRDLIIEYKKNHESVSGYPSLEFADDGYSGTNFERPAMQKLLVMVKERKIDCIIVKDISRFGRNYLEVGDYLEQVFPFMGVRFISINDHYDSNDYVGTTGGIEVAFRSLMYDIYSKDLSIKMRTALEVRRKRGDYIGPRPPFGYAFSENKRKLTVDPIAAEYVKRIFMLAGLGYNTGKIAMMLNKEAVPTPGQYKNMGKSKESYHMSDGIGFWDAKRVMKIIENKVYLGMTVNGKSSVTRIGGKQFIRVPDEERICVQNMHEAIVSEKMFQDAKQIIQGQGAQRHKSHKKSREGILLGKLCCGECHRSLIRTNSTTIPYYKCKKKYYYANCTCPKLRLQEPEIEATVWKCIEQELAKIEKIKNQLISNNDLGIMETKISSLMTANQKVKKDKQHLYEKYKSGLISKEKYKQLIEQLRNSEIKNSGLLAGIESKRDTVMENVESTKESGVCSGLTRELVDAFIIKIYVYDNERIEIIWEHNYS